jgi:hypothetical protein
MISYDLPLTARVLKSPFAKGDLGGFACKAGGEPTAEAYRQRQIPPCPFAKVHREIPGKAALILRKK